jgi:hypothetical protein
MRAQVIVRTTPRTVPVRTTRRTWPCSSATVMFRNLSVTVATETRRRARVRGARSKRRLSVAVCVRFQSANRQRTFVRLRRRHSRGVDAGLQPPHNQQGSTAAGVQPLACSLCRWRCPLSEASAYVTPDTVARPRMRSSEAGERARRECVRAVAKARDCVHRNTVLGLQGYGVTRGALYCLAGPGCIRPHPACCSTYP